MDEAQRRALVERFQRIQSAEEKLRARIPAEAREDLAQLDPGARRDAWREMLAHEMAQRGRELREMLPPQWRQRIEATPPHERPRVLEEFRRHLRGDLADRAVHALGRDLDLPPAEVERLRGLPPDARAREIAELHRRDLVRRVEQHGLPPSVSPDEWARWKALPTPEFLELWKARVKGGPRPPDGAPSPNARPQRDGARPPQLDPERMRKLGDSMRPDPRWFAELSKLDPEARREAVDGRIRERVLKHLEALPELFDAVELARLRALRFHELLDAVRARVREVAPPPPPRGEAHPPGQPPPGAPRPAGPRGSEPQRPLRSL
jgi:hypothetical protein